MEIESFLAKLPDGKREIYRKVFEADSSNCTNANTAENLNITISMVEQIRSDLFEAKLIKKRKSSYRKSAGLSPSREKQSRKTSINAGLSGGKTRHTFIIDESNLENIKLLAHLDHKGINDFLNNLLSAYFSQRLNDITTATDQREKSARIKLKIEPDRI